MLERTIQILTLISLCGGAWFYMESNFVQAADFAAYQQNVYEDKIFVLQFKEAQLKQQGKALKPLDKAMLERLKKRLDSINKK